MQNFLLFSTLCATVQIDILKVIIRLLIKVYFSAPAFLQNRDGMFDEEMTDCFTH